MITSVIVFLIILLIIAILIFNRGWGFVENFLDLKFSNINDDISNGNPLSVSNEMLITDPKINPLYGKKTKIPNLTIQGHGIPLRYEETVTKPVQDSIFYFNRRIASPSCCPAYYSTSQGCVC